MHSFNLLRISEPVKQFMENIFFKLPGIHDRTSSFSYALGMSIQIWGMTLFRYVTFIDSGGICENDSLLSVDLLTVRVSLGDYFMPSLFSIIATAGIIATSFSLWPTTTMLLIKL